MKRHQLILILIETITLLPFAGPLADVPASTRPVIDMHLHAFDTLTTPPGVEVLPGVVSAENADDLQQRSLAALKRHNVVLAIASGPRAEHYRATAPQQILASPLVTNTSIPATTLQEQFRSGRYQALAEFAPQYAGIAPDDPVLEPYFALAEELDVPMGIHVGIASPGVAYHGAPKYRMALGDPLLLEDVLLRHPKLRLYVMHAGWPMLDEMMALLWAHPQVHVDLGVIVWGLPAAEFYRYLQTLVDAGFTDRILFGSDQMDWPDAIGVGIQRIESTPFLTDAQKADILCGNAMRFLRLEKTICDPATQALTNHAHPQRLHE